MSQEQIKAFEESLKTFRKRLRESGKLTVKHSVQPCVELPNGKKTTLKVA
jgi:hypothetical protein